MRVLKPTRGVQVVDMVLDVRCAVRCVMLCTRNYNVIMTMPSMSLPVCILRRALARVVQGLVRERLHKVWELTMPHVTKIFRLSMSASFGTTVLRDLMRSNVVVERLSIVGRLGMLPAVVLLFR